ncbi:MAG: hypothetical protein CMJ75_18690 [Planctomycetaceae bacterium]|nr:hypothetical protein [Planctomycetaceae bacterium]
MTTNHDLIATAREYARLKVPYVHNGRSRAGVDCSGLMLMCAWENGVELDDWPEKYDRVAYGWKLMRGMRCQMDEIAWEDRKIGDWVTMWFNRRSKEPQHCALLVERPDGPGIIHAYQNVHHVTESPLAKKWERRITNVFRLRGVEYT